MAFGRDGVESGYGLALSGGGFRAALFHVGALRRLVEFGLLHRLARISSVSGGSIVTGRLAEVWDEFSAEPTVASYERCVAVPLREFCRLHIDAVVLSEGVLSPARTAADFLEEQYRSHLFQKRLDQLPGTPTFVFNATNLQTGRSFRFGKKYMGDYRLGLIDGPTLPVARAVAASSAFPPFFSPVIISDPGEFKYVQGADLNKDPEFTRKLFLGDGGIYDNLGLETVWNRYDTVLVSDAGAPFAIGPVPHVDWLRQTMRALDIATDQSRGLRKRALIADYVANVRKGAYWGIETDIGAYGLADALPCNSDKTSALARMRTRLNPFSDEEQGLLINWGYALADAAMRRHAPDLVTAAPAPSWPERGHAL